MLLGAALVAVASSGDLGVEGVRRPGDRALDLLISFGAVAVVVALLGGAVLYGLGWHLKLREGGRGERSRWLTSFGFFAAVILALLALSYLRRRVADPAENEAGEVVVGSPGRSAADTAGGGGYEPEFTTVPVLVFLAAVLAGLVAVVLWHRSRRGAAPGEAAEPGPTLAELLADTVDDLRAEPDPRRAVIAAYARLGRALAAAGHPRRRSDAPGEYLGRVLREAEVSPAAVRRLTALFARAKFSQHTVGEAMRHEAIDALEEVRGDLRAAEEARAAPVPAW